MRESICLISSILEAFWSLDLHIFSPFICTNVHNFLRGTCICTNFTREMMQQNQFKAYLEREITSLPHRGSVKSSYVSGKSIFPNRWMHLAMKICETIVVKGMSINPLVSVSYRTTRLSHNKYE